MVEVFVSYSHKDEHLRQELETHLSALRNQGVVSVWHDRQIEAGEELAKEIDRRLEEADIVLLLISPDFLASAYCYDREMQRAMERHEQRDARVVPVILRPCDWHHAPFGKLMAVPTDGRPVLKHESLDDGFVDVVRAIRKIATPAANAPFAPSDTSSPGREDLRRPGVPPRLRSDVPRLLPIAPRLSSARPRARDLRVQREFSDYERHTFLGEAFDYVAQYFENSLDELDRRDDQVSVRFTRRDVGCFEAIAYIYGEERSRCGIWRGEPPEVDAIFFSSNGAGNSEQL